MVKKIKINFSDKSSYESEVYEPYSLQMFIRDNIKRFRVFRDINSDSLDSLILEILKNTQYKTIESVEYIINDITVGKIENDEFRITYSIDDNLYKDYPNNLIAESLDIVSGREL